MALSKKTSHSTRERIKRLDALVEAGQLLNSSLDLNRVLTVLVDVAMKNLNAARGTIYLVDHEKNELWSEVVKGEASMQIRLPIGKGIAGYVGKTGKNVNLPDVYKDKRFFQGVDQISGFRTKTMLCMPMKDRRGHIVGVFQIMNKKKGLFTNQDERFLTALSIPATIAIENARLHRAQIEQEIIQKELEVAASIQQRLLPKVLPALEGVQISAVTRPCRAVGGDFYDIIKMDEDRIVVVIADVSGKGISSGLLVAALQASMHAYLDLGLSSIELVRKLNKTIHEDSTSEGFISFVICVYERSTRKLRSINAGHNYPIIFRSAGGTTELSKGGLCLGMLPEADYEEEEIQLYPGDLLMLYTDGVTESMSKEQDLYGEARLYARVNTMLHKNVKEIEEEIYTDVTRFMNGYPAVDDFTMVLLKVA